MRRKVDDGAGQPVLGDQLPAHLAANQHKIQLTAGKRAPPYRLSAQALNIYVQLTRRRFLLVRSSV